MILSLLTYDSFQTCMTFFLLWNTKVDILQVVFFHTLKDVVLDTIDFLFMDKAVLPLYSAEERKSYRFGTTLQ